MTKKQTSKKDHTAVDRTEAIRCWVANNANKPFTLREMAHRLQITRNNREEAQQILQTMVDKKTLVFRQGKYRLRNGNTHKETEGILSMAANGYGFVPAEEGGDDIFIPQRALLGALHGDTVRISYSLNAARRNKRNEGEVEAIVERSKRPYVGILQVMQHRAYVITEHRHMPYDIKIPANELLGAENGQKVAALVIDWDAKNREPVGKIVNVLGEPGDNNTEMHAILAEFGLPYTFNSDVMREAEAIPSAITDRDVAERRDFRGITTFTIDPTDAKDFDDALSYRPLPNGRCEIGVHIADVTHYVQPGMLIEKEATERATSVYLVDRTISMLPEKLSNHLCSLRPHEDKLCFSVVFEMDGQAQITNQWFGRTVVRSIHRFSYDEAQQVIETGNGTLAGEIGHLHRLAQQLRTTRLTHGALSFERPEPKIEVDAHGKPLRIYFKEQKEANFLIEEFMLLANRCVAERIGNQPKPKTFVYRVHEEPNEEKLQAFREFIKHFGYKMKATKTPLEAARELNKLLTQVKGRPEETVIETMALRSMARAHYATDNAGHYGLAFDYYTHFTSPIRRYPDMMVHRLLAQYLANGHSANRAPYEEHCKYCSAREGVATDAERASIKYKMVEYMQDKIGNQYAGTVSGITEWGLYVEIDENHVEGMVSIRNMHDDHYLFDEKTYALTGQRTGRRICLGDPVYIKVKRANLEQKQLDFVLAKNNKD